MRGVSTFGAFTTARLGIYAAQKALDVTGHNITNINTAGYTRQRVDQMSLRVGATNRYASQYDTIVGSGVLCTGVSQLRDPYLDIRFRNEQSSVGAMDTKLAGLEEISNILDEVSKGDGSGILEAQFNDLVTQLHNLSLKAGTEENDSLVRSSANSLVKLLNSYADQLNTIQKNQDLSFRQDVDTVNNILKNISDLNSSIFKSEVHGDSSLELKDQRNLLLDQLSQYVKINVEYKSVSIGAGKTVDQLMVSLAGTPKGDATKSRSVLVDGSYATQFSLRAGSTNYDLNLSALTNAKGDTLASSTPVALGDLDLYGSLQSAREMLTEAGEYTPEGVISGAGAYDSDAATKRGIPYYQKALDSMANKLASLMNEANSGYMVDNNGYYLDSSGNKLSFNDGTTTVEITKYMTLTQDQIDYRNANAAKAPSSGPLFSNNGSGNDPTSITAANISISKDWSVGTVRIVNSTIMGSTSHLPNSSANDNILNMITLLDGKHAFCADEVAPGSFDGDKPFFNGSFQEMLANVSGTLANDVKATSVLLNNYSASATEISVNRSSVSGVDLNDEATNLMQYQKSYSAACRLMTTLDEALDKLINGTGAVGR